MREKWWTKSWNPVTGCTKISEGCRNCYAERMSKRLAGRFGYPKDNPFAVTLHPDKLNDPLRWKKPQRIFVASMGDIGHEDVPYDWIRGVFHIMDLARQHQYILLTKRPRRLQSFIRHDRCDMMSDYRHVTLMATAENQRRADERIPILLQTPAAMRGLSLEPMLGPVNLNLIQTGEYAIDALTGDQWSDSELCSPEVHSRLNHVILGAETGPRARPMQLDWARRTRDDCVAVGVPFYFKVDSQGNHELDGKIWEQYPGREATK